MKEFRKNKVRIMTGLMVIAALSLFGACSNPSGSDSGVTYSVTAADFKSTIESIANTPGKYTINLTDDLYNYSGFYLDNAGVSITVNGTGVNNITWKPADVNPGSLFSVNSGSLILKNIKLGLSSGNLTGQSLLWISGGTLEISGVTLDNNGSGDGVGMSGGSFKMSGGTIQNCKSGVIANNSTGNVSITMTGGLITGNTETGIALGSDSTSGNVTISGGTISDNNDGVSSIGENSQITVKGGLITGNTRTGIVLWADCKNCKLAVGGNAVVSCNGSMGGVTINGIGSQFNKQQGSIIYGTDGTNANTNYAIMVFNTSWEPLLVRTNDAGKNDILSAELNAAGDTVANSSAGWGTP